MLYVVVATYASLCVLAFMCCRMIWRAAKQSPASELHIELRTAVFLASALFANDPSLGSSEDC